MKTKIKILIKTLFIISAFVIIFNKIDLNELKKIHFSSPLFLAVAFIIYNISQIVSALRVHKYLENINITPSFREQLTLYYLGMFYNTLFPGGIGGDAYKAYKFQKTFDTGYKKIIKALLIDRFSGLFAILTLTGFLILFSSLKGFFIYISLLGVIAPAGMYLLHKLFFKEFLNTAPKNFIYSLIIQTLQGGAFLSVLYSLGIHSHLNEYLMLFFISSILSVIPVSVGGIGLRELTFLWGLEFLHINPAPGVLSAFLFFIIATASSLIGLFFLKSNSGEQ